MPKQPINTLKSWFKTGLKPLQQQFWDWMDSYWHKDEKIPADAVEGLQDMLNGFSTTVALQGVSDSVQQHVGDTGNPHKVTAAQLGLGNVDNTSDINKPVSTLMQEALDAKADGATLDNHTADKNNPHAVTKEQVGLGNVDNTSDADKPVSKATQAAINAAQGSKTLADVLNAGNTAIAGTASKAPVVFPPGTLLTTPQPGALEYDGTSLYITNSSNSRTALTGGSSATKRVYKTQYKAFTNNTVSIAIPDWTFSSSNDQAMLANIYIEVFTETEPGGSYVSATLFDAEIYRMTFNVTSQTSFARYMGHASISQSVGTSFHFIRGSRDESTSVWGEYTSKVFTFMHTTSVNPVLKITGSSTSTKYVSVTIVLDKQQPGTTIS